MLPVMLLELKEKNKAIFLKKEKEDYRDKDNNNLKAGIYLYLPLNFRAS